MGWEWGEFSDGWQFGEKRFTASVGSASGDLGEPADSQGTRDTQTTSGFGNAPPSSGVDGEVSRRMRRRSGTDPTHPKQLMGSRARSGRTMCLARAGGGGAS